MEYSLQVSFDSASSLKAALTAIELSQYDQCHIMETEEVYAFAQSLWSGCFWSEKTDLKRPAIIESGFSPDRWDENMRDWREIARMLRDSADCIDKYLDGLESRNS